MSLDLLLIPLNFLLLIFWIIFFYRSYTAFYYFIMFWYLDPLLYILFLYFISVFKS